MMQIIGSLLFIVGLAGLGGYCDGQGSFMVSAIVFSIGLGLCLLNTIKAD